MFTVLLENVAGQVLLARIVPTISYLPILQPTSLHILPSPLQI